MFSLVFRTYLSMSFLFLKRKDNKKMKFYFFKAITELKRNIVVFYKNVLFLFNVKKNKIVEYELLQQRKEEKERAEELETKLANGELIIVDKETFKKIEEFDLFKNKIRSKELFLVKNNQMVVNKKVVSLQKSNILRNKSQFKIALLKEG